jgi:methionine-rich copper-binding protein CopC
VFTNSVADTTLPVVSATAPANGATGVLPGSAITVSFNEAMDAATIGAATFELRNTAANSPVAGSVSYNTATRVATFTPSAALLPGTPYSASVRGGSTDPRAKDSAGNALAATVAWAFTTAAVDATPPTISARSPADGTASVALNSTVALTFSENMDATTVNGTTLQLRSSAGAAVAASIAYNAATRVATLTPSAALLPSTTYIATAAGGSTDPRLKDASGNALAATSQWSFATVIADTVAPTITATTPSNGATGVATGGNIVVTFSEPMEAGSLSSSSIELRQTTGGALVAASVAYATAAQTATLTPSSTLAPATAYTVTVRGGADAPQVRDSAGNALSASASWSFTTAAGPSCPCTIWPATATPAVAASSDTGSVNLGVKFRADVAGYITGIRFYKGSGNAGSHVGALWNSGGQLLAQATFVNESATGWQQVNFGAPVAIAANTIYVASYLAPVGRYAIDANYFATSGVDNAPLRALGTTGGAGNGVYLYGSSPAFPSSTFNASNYWIDVVFATSAVDNIAPAITARVPAPGTTAVVRSSPISVTFSEPVDAATVSSTTLLLRDAQGAAVPAAVSYNASTQAATLTPSGLLTPSAQYSATVRGGAVDPVVKDLAGNRLGADSNWSFTTAAADTTSPTVTSTSPIGAATGISRTANITVTFSEAMTATTINAATIELRTPAGVVVASVVSYNATNRRATLNPNPTLSALTTYTVLVRGGANDPRVQDAAGNALAADRVWTFTTR